MIDVPQIVPAESQTAALIRLTISRAEMQAEMGPAIREILGVVQAQGLTPVGPVFAHHFRLDPKTFDFEVGVPVAKGVKAVGRVKPGKLPAAEVVRTVYHGPYEGLEAAWKELRTWITAKQLATANDFWERYLAGPESGADAKKWKTELNRPLKR
ncbi:MAG: GyrI-like domain-containing protein [Planctomycetota bacterium]